MSVDASEQGARGNACMVNPIGEVLDGTPAGAAMRYGDLSALASLVSFGSAQVQDNALPDVLQVSNIEPDKLRTSESSGETDQQQGAVAAVNWAVPHLCENREQVVTLQCLRFALCRAHRSPDPAHHRFDDLGLAGVGMAQGAMGLGDGDEPTLDRGHGVCLGDFCEVCSDTFGCGWDFPPRCPEMPDVGCVSALRVGR